MKPITSTLALTVALLSASAIACAAPIFAGSWNLYSGPSYLDEPPLYTGQQAAAALFGGTADDYVISTVGKLVADIDYQAWYDLHGLGVLRSGQAYLKDDGLAGIYDATGDASAMVRDHPYEEGGAYPYVNYAFRVSGPASDVPEPMSVGLLGAGLLGMALVRRKRATRR
jgi:hypothetical protein